MVKFLERICQKLHFVRRHYGWGQRVQGNYALDSSDVTGFVAKVPCLVQNTFSSDHGDQVYS